MHYAITSSNSFSGQWAGISRISPVELAGSVRKSPTNRPFICHILRFISLARSLLCPLFLSCVVTDSIASEIEIKPEIIMSE